MRFFGAGCRRDALYYFFIGKTAFVSAACAETAIKHPRRTVAHKSLKFDLQGIVVAKMWQSFTVS